MIEVRGLTKYYGATRAIYDLDFTIDDGAVVGFLGLNGAGKSTALKILAGSMLPTAGTVRVDGVDLLAEPEQLRARIGYLPEVPPLHDEMTVHGYLTWLARLRKVPAGRVAERVAQVAERCALTDRLHQTIGTLSLGYRRRVGIAQAIVHDPRLVILDEPISGLDPAQIVEMRALVRSLRGEHTVLVSSHILIEVEETCDCIILFKDGELRAQGTEVELLAMTAPDADYEVRFVGDAAEALAAALGCAVVATASITRDDGGSGLLAARLTEDRPEALAAALFNAGLGVRGLQPAAPQLEGAFLNLLGKGGVA